MICPIHNYFAFIPVCYKSSLRSLSVSQTRLSLRSVESGTFLLIESRRISRISLRILNQRRLDPLSRCCSPSLLVSVASPRLFQVLSVWLCVQPSAVTQIPHVEARRRPELQLWASQQSHQWGHLPKQPVKEKCCWNTTVLVCFSLQFCIWKCLSYLHHSVRLRLLLSNNKGFRDCENS